MGYNICLEDVASFMDNDVELIIHKGRAVYSCTARRIPRDLYECVITSAFVQSDAFVIYVKNP